MIQPVPQHGQPQTISLAMIDTRPQIRTRNGFDQASLTELADSIRVHGLLQPVVVTSADAGGRHMLVIGERRLLAASMAGLAESPAMVRDGTPADLAAAQAVENLQREDLHLADVIDGLTALARVYPTWREVARAIGKSPAWVSKRRAMMRLRPATAQAMREGWSVDAEVLLTLNQIEKLDGAKAERLAERLGQGMECRESIRAALDAMKAPADDEADGERDDGEGSSPTKPARGMSLKLDAMQAPWLRNLVREHAEAGENKRAILAALDAWFDAQKA